ncbi:hypothetical protein AAV98_11060 [Bacillus sp. CHD6a]|nr:hypothetical protein AAV98_11060 [Bacillus sp. CHD6a]
MLEATEKDLDFKILLNTAVDFRKWLRFPRGAAGASSASPAGSPPSAISFRSLRLLLQSTARNRKKHYVISFSVASFVAGSDLSLLRRSLRAFHLG